MTKSQLSNFFISFLWLSSALTMLIRVYSLRFNSPGGSIYFWIPYLILISTSAFVVLTREDSYSFLIILGMALVLHLVPFFREPEGLIWNTDPSQNLQIAAKVMTTGHLAIGSPDFTAIAVGQSYYPGLEIFMCYLNMITGISLVTLYKGALAPINVITLILFFTIMKMIIKNQKILNLCIFLYALCPKFNGFDSLGIHESLAIIFYPLLMSAFLTDQRDLFRSRKFSAVLFLSVFLLTLTHHFTMYMLILHAITIIMGTYVSKKRVYTTQINFMLLLVILIFTWQFFNAYLYFIKWHGSVVINMIQSLLLRSEFHTSIEIPSFSYLSAFERNAAYAGIGLFLVTSLFGAYVAGWRKNKEYSVLVLLWAIDSAIIGIFEMVNWHGFDPAIRFRDLEFVYFGIAPLSAIGLQKIVDFGNSWKFSNLTKIISLVLLVIIALPTTILGFNYYYYDNLPRIAENVYPVESHFSSIWLKNYNAYDLVAGSSDGGPYINGYASKEFSNLALVDSIKQHRILNKLYWVNSANLILPDSSGFKIENDEITWFYSQLNGIYDNGAVTIYYLPT